MATETTTSGWNPALPPPTTPSDADRAARKLSLKQLHDCISVDQHQCGQCNPTTDEKNLPKIPLPASILVPVSTHSLSIWESDDIFEVVCISPIPPHQGHLAAHGFTLNGTQDLVVEDVRIRLTHAACKVGSKNIPSRIYNDTKYIEKCFQEPEHHDQFAEAYRELKHSLIAAGLWGSCFGYLDSLELSLMLAYFWTAVPERFPVVSKFAEHYASFDWASSVATDNASAAENYRRGDEAMVLLDSAGNHNLTSHITPATLAATISHLRTPHLGLPTATSFVKITLNTWDGPVSVVRTQMQRLETRLPTLLSTIPSNITAHLWPASLSPACDMGEILSVIYLIGLTPPATASRPEKKSLQTALTAALASIEADLQSYIDPSAASQLLLIEQIPLTKLEAMKLSSPLLATLPDLPESSPTGTPATSKSSFRAAIALSAADVLSMIRDNPALDQFDFNMTVLDVYGRERKVGIDAPEMVRGYEVRQIEIVGGFVLWEWTGNMAAPDGNWKFPDSARDETYKWLWEDCGGKACEQEWKDIWTDAVDAWCDPYDDVEDPYAN
ncbi:hypothetical protein EDC01DRAFT_41361 [Geopyxis carbonaria]|nr:hypothetical protein EDC01DRAFT_41361 [Geopyxis carbonaria]